MAICTDYTYSQALVKIPTGSGFLGRGFRRLQALLSRGAAGAVAVSLCLGLLADCASAPEPIKHDPAPYCDRETMDLAEHLPPSGWVNVEQVRPVFHALARCNAYNEDVAARQTEIAKARQPMTAQDYWDAFGDGFWSHQDH